MLKLFVGIACHIQRVSAMLSTGSAANSKLTTMGASAAGGPDLLTLAGGGSEELGCWLPVEPAGLGPADPSCEDACGLFSEVVSGFHA